MAFIQGKGNRRFRHDSTINVTPLVDVMLVLLIIFMVAAPMMTVGLQVDLPKTKAAQLLNQDQEPLIITINEKGDVFIQESSVPFNELSSKLQAITKGNFERVIFVRGDQKLAYGKVMEVMGRISSAGFPKVSLIAELPATEPKTIDTLSAKKRQK